jgi:chromosome segregation ATPase
METENKETTYNISKHARERYASRILNKEDNNEIQRFILENEDKITTDINKMIQFGECIYTGKTAHKDDKGKTVSVYLKDCWIILVDAQKSKNVITLYKIDLGCGDDFNLQYISKMMEQLEEKKDNLLSVQLEVDEESRVFKEMIDGYEAQINEFKANIKNLENLCADYKDIIDNNKVKFSMANREVADVINKLIGKKEF